MEHTGVARKQRNGTLGREVDHDEEASKEAYEAMLTWTDRSESKEDWVKWC